MIVPPAGRVIGRRQSGLAGHIAVELLALSVVFGAVLGSMGAVLWTRAVRARFDGALGSAAREVLSRLGEHTPSDAGLAAAVGGIGLPGVNGRSIVVVRDAGGRVLASVPPSAPVPQFDHAPGTVPELTTIAAGPLSTVVGDGPVRVVSCGAGGEYTVQIAVSRSDLAEKEAAAWWAALLAIPLATGGSTLAAWAVASRRLARIRRLAAQVGPSLLHRRLNAAGEKGELGRLADEINAMLARLEADFASQERFVSEVSHELKTPVSVVLLEAQILERSDPDELAYARFVVSVEEEMRRLGALVESFLALARARHGEDRVHRDAVDLNDAAVEAGRHCWAYARMRDIRFSVTLVPDDAGPDLPVVSGDADLLRTLIENLLRNAITVAPRQSTIDLRVACEGNDVIVRVRDRGPGVPESLAPRIFERFVTGDHARTGHRGTGLGLAIAKGIAELHGGDIGFRNLPASEGGGAEFAARVPLLRPAVQGRIGQSAEPAAT